MLQRTKEQPCFWRPLITYIPELSHGKGESDCTESKEKEKNKHKCLELAFDSPVGLGLGLGFLFLFVCEWVPQICFDRNAGR